MHLGETEEIIAACQQQCDRILSLFDSDMLSVETEHFVDGSQETKSTVGIMVHGCVVCS